MSKTGVVLVVENATKPRTTTETVSIEPGPTGTFTVILVNELEMTVALTAPK